MSYLYLMVCSARCIGDHTQQVQCFCALLFQMMYVMFNRKLRQESIKIMNYPTTRGQTFCQRQTSKTDCRHWGDV